MPFAFSTSALFLPDLCSILRPKCEAQDRAMLHAAIINFRRRIVNRTRGFSCRAAAQFNPGLEVLRWDYGGGKEGPWWWTGDIVAAVRHCKAAPLERRRHPNSYLGAMGWPFGATGMPFVPPP